MIISPCGINPPGSVEGEGEEEILELGEILAEILELGE